MTRENLLQQVAGMDTGVRCRRNQHARGVRGEDQCDGSASFRKGLGGGTRFLSQRGWSQQSPPYSLRSRRTGGKKISALPPCQFQTDLLAILLCVGQALTERGHGGWQIVNRHCASTG